MQVTQAGVRNHYIWHLGHGGTYDAVAWTTDAFGGRYKPNIFHLVPKLGIGQRLDLEDGLKTVNLPARRATQVETGQV